MRYFLQFPLVAYKGNFAVDITKRVKLLGDAKTSATIFYDYEIKDGETIDSIANDYYGDPYYFWLVAFANDMTDLYYDWPMQQLDFQRFIEKKYGTFQTAATTILYYEKPADVFYVHIHTNSVVTQAQYNALSAGQQSQYELADPQPNLLVSPQTYATTDDPGLYSEIYALDWEVEQNEKKRKIRLLDLTYLRLAEDNLKELLK